MLYCDFRNPFSQVLWNSNHVYSWEESIFLRKINILFWIASFFCLHISIRLNFSIKSKKTFGNLPWVILWCSVQLWWDNSILTPYLTPIFTRERHWSLHMSIFSHCLYHKFRWKSLSHANGLPPPNLSYSSVNIKLL